MKQRVLTVLTMSSLLVTLAVVPVFGYGFDHRMRANVPFDFIVGDKTLPAGTYTISKPTLSGTLRIENVDSGESTVVMSTVVEGFRPNDETKFVFKRYADQYFLDQVWVVGDLSGDKLVKSRAEHEAAKNLAQSESVRIAAN